MKKSIGSIKANYEWGEAEVKLNSEFESQNALWRMDVLRDIIYDLQIQYQKAYKEHREYYEEIRKKRKLTSLRG
jgi:hypothetical protein